jgi:hypothetical protein
MPDEMTNEEKFAQAWLRSRGYDADRDVSIIREGRKPDFIAKAPAPLWGEVKALDMEDSMIAIGDAATVIKSVTIPSGLTGFATLFVNAGSREQSIRAILKLFAEHGPKYQGSEVTLIFTQQETGVKGIQRVDFNSAMPPKRLWIRGPGNGKFSAPPGEIEDGLAIATITRSGKTEDLEAFRLFEWGTNAQLDCALVAKLRPNDHPLSISPMSGGTATIGARVLKALENANGQIKNACKYLEAPGVIIIVPPLVGYADSMQIAAGCYGKLMMSISVGEPVRGPSYLEHGPDAAFQPEKNRHISVVIRLDRDGNASMYFPNPYAHRPIDKDSPLLRGLTCYGDEVA